MQRVFLSALVIGAFIFSTLPVDASSRRCPVKMPETLLSLYKKSDAIFIARFDRKEDVNIASEGDGYSVVNVKTHFDVSFSLKGESQKLFVLEDEEYRYKTQPQDENEPGEQAVFIEDRESSGGGGELKAGDPVLLFLKKGEDGESLVLSDYRDAVKGLTPEQLPVYIERIKELNSIFDGGKVDHEEIVAWLIRCAEDPATRWEGTFELLQSLERSEWKSKAKETQETDESGGENIREEEEDMSGYLGGVGDTSIFAELLTPEQKQSLANVLLNQENKPAGSGDEKKAAFARGDRELIEMVKRWGDGRIVPFLLEQLRSGSFSPYENAQMMDAIAVMADDKEAIALARQYSDISFLEDDTEVEETLPDTADEVEPAESGTRDDVSEEQVAEVEAAVADTSEKIETEPAADKPKKQTYRELREQLSSEFVAIVAKALQSKENKDRTVK